MNENSQTFARLFLLAITCISGYLSYGNGSEDSSKVIRILTYNIYHGETMKGDFDLDLIADVIKSAKPDLVALQEVDFFTNRARNMDLATELGKRTGLAPLFGKAMEFDGGEYGEGILSRFSFLKTKNHALVAQPGNEPRSALEICVVLRSGDTVRFIGTHLDHTKNERDRINQAKQINKLFTDDDVPTILAGDLNARPDSKTMKILFSEWTKSFIDDTPTFPCKEPKVKIDCILYRPANRWNVLETKVLDAPLASDHCPVLTIVGLK